MGGALHFIFTNWPWKLVSLGAAVMIWLSVASEPEVMTILQVPVQYKNAPADLEISSEILSTVGLELQGQTSALRSFAASPPPVVLDFSGVRAPGVRTFEIEPPSLALPKGVSLIRSVPSELRFAFEPKIEKDVPVQVSWVGHASVQCSVDPASMRVVGPESRVSKVQAVITDPVNLAHIEPGQTILTSPYLPESQVRFVHYRAIRVRVDSVSANQ